MEKETHPKILHFMLDISKNKKSFYKINVCSSFSIFVYLSDKFTFIMYMVNMVYTNYIFIYPFEK